MSVTVITRASRQRNKLILRLFSVAGDLLHVSIACLMILKTSGQPARRQNTSLMYLTTSRNVRTCYTKLIQMSLKKSKSYRPAHKGWRPWLRW